MVGYERHRMATKDNSVRYYHVKTYADGRRERITKEVYMSHMSKKGGSPSSQMSDSEEDSVMKKLNKIYLTYKTPEVYLIENIESGEPSNSNEWYTSILYPEKYKTNEATLPINPGDWFIYDKTENIRGERTKVIRRGYVFLGKEEGFCPIKNLSAVPPTALYSSKAIYNKLINTIKRLHYLHESDMGESEYHLNNTPLSTTRKTV